MRNAYNILLEIPQYTISDKRGRIRVIQVLERQVIFIRSGLKWLIIRVIVLAFMPKLINLLASQK
jgi:hypothetical protein